MVDFSFPQENNVKKDTCSHAPPKLSNQTQHFFFFSHFYNHSRSSKHHVGVQYVLQYCHDYRSTFWIKKFSLHFKKGCVLQCIAVTNKELSYVHKIKIFIFIVFVNTRLHFSLNVDNNFTLRILPPRYNFILFACNVTTRSKHQIPKEKYIFIN